MHSCIVSADENLITINSGFENGVSSWFFNNITNAGGQVSYYEETGDDFVREGRFCLKMELPTAQASATMGNYNKSYSNAIQLEVGSMYEFSIWINTGDSAVSGGEGAYAMVRTYKADNGSGVGTGNAYYSTNHVKNTHGEWVKLSARFQAVVACPIQYIYIGFDANTSGTVYWDDAKLIKYEDKTTFGYYSFGENGEYEVFDIMPDVNIKAKLHIGAENDAPKSVVMVSTLYTKNDSGVPNLIAVEIVKTSSAAPTDVSQTKGFTVSSEQFLDADYYMKTFFLDDANALRHFRAAEIIQKAVIKPKNLFQNGDFETMNGDNSGPANWTPYDYSWNNSVSLCTQDVYSGQNCVKISTQQSNTNPYIRYDMTGLIPGTEYTIDVWFKTHASLGGSPIIKFQYYHDTTSLDGASQAALGLTGGAWNNATATVVAPENCNRMSILLRLNGSGEIYYDNLSFYVTKLPETLIIDSDTFFYTEWETGTVSVRVNNSIYTATDEATIDVKLKDGNTVIAQKSFLAAEDEFFTFDISDMSVIGKGYTLEAILYDYLGGNKIGKCEKTIYRYNRPTALNEKGEFIIDEKGEWITDGSAFVPVIGYHVYLDDRQLKAAKATGVNVVQGTGGTVSDAKIYLDNCYANGMKATLLLYSGMQIAGSDEKIENTIEVVTAVKDHPALFGYLIMDEPYLHYSNPYNDLVKSYKTIRDIDPVHPVIIQDSTSTGSSALCASCADILIIHDYAINIDVIDRFGIANTTNMFQASLDAFSGTNIQQKPIYFLGQTFGAATREEAEAVGEKYYLPTIDEAKNMLYQGVWLGAQGFGYYSFRESNWALINTPLYSGLTEFANKELSFLIDEFIMHKHTRIHESKDGDYWWRISQDGENIYVLVLNMAKTAKSITLPLKDNNGVSCIASYTGEKIGGTGLANTISGNGSISLNVPAHGTVVYKLTPGL
ncbi:MAG: carbohydrate binding domain-containing protein [Clostridia bacterium]|nr:carbohydrate binding domain-containing protein [Clostridia bacterium]